MFRDAFAHASTIDRSDIAITQGLLDTPEEEEVEEIDYLVCDNCGNESWYIVVPKPNEKAVAFFQVQICTKCGFAVRIDYKLISVTRSQISSLEDLLSNMEEESANGRNFLAVQKPLEKSRKKCKYAS